MLNKVIHGDCLIESDNIESGSVDLILTDLPYGTIKDADLGKHDTSWDVVIEPKKIYDIANRILRKNGKMVLFGNEPFSSKLINESIPNIPFSYRMIWLKDQPAFSMYVGCKKRPMSYYEDILVFSKTHDTNCIHPLRSYFKQVFEHIGRTKKVIIEEVGQRADHVFRVNTTQFAMCTEATYNELINRYRIDKMQGFKPYQELKKIDQQHFLSVFNLWEGGKYKSNILRYKKDYDGYHPTQKPILLLEDLIKTFSNEGDLVVDLTMGSGSTGVACVNTNRNFIGIELDDKYFEIAKRRIERHMRQISIFDLAKESK